MFKSSLALVGSGLLITLTGCSSCSEPQQEKHPWDTQKENRPWYRSDDTVGGSLEKQEREKTSRHKHDRYKKKH